MIEQSLFFFSSVPEKKVVYPNHIIEIDKRRIKFDFMNVVLLCESEYSCLAEPPVRSTQSQCSGATEPL